MMAERTPANNRKRGEDKYSYHGDAFPRVVAALQNYPAGEPMYASGIARQAEVSIPTVSKVLRELIANSLVTEGRYSSIPPHNIPATLLYTTPALEAAIANNPEWNRAAVIKGLMDATGMDEGQVLDWSLGLLQRELEGPIRPANQLEIPYPFMPNHSDGVE